MGDGTLCCMFLRQSTVPTAYSILNQTRCLLLSMMIEAANVILAGKLKLKQVTVWRSVKLFKRTGDATKKAYSCRPTYKITPIIQLSVAHAVLWRPGIYLRKIQMQIVEEHGEELSLSAIHRFLHRSGFTRQRLKIAATQRDCLLRSQFVLDVSLCKTMTHTANGDTF